MKMCVCQYACMNYLINYISINEIIKHDQGMYISYVLFINHYISTNKYKFKIIHRNGCVVLSINIIIQFFAIVLFSTNKILLNLYILKII